MAIARIDCVLFGYRRFKIPVSELAPVTSRLLRSGISVLMRSNGTFDARERDAAAVKQLLSDVEYEESEPKGLLGRIRSFKHKAAFLCALAVSILLIALSSGVVWDIRVEGNERLPDGAIIDELEKSGFSVGDLWLLTDKSGTEASVLASSSDIGWININRRGTVAYVTVREREPNVDQPPNTQMQYANIVATEDCVIEEITVTRGQAVVKVGDVVKRGDMLVLGVLPESSGGGLCRAEGRIVGRISRDVTVSVAREQQIKERGDEKTCSVTLNFFGFDLNIFKKYGNLPESCVIIEEIRTFSLFGRCTLPVSVSYEICGEYELKTRSYTDEELIAVAGARLRAETAGALARADLLRIRTDGGFTDSGYTMTNYLTYTAEVGEQMPYSVD